MIEYLDLVSCRSLLKPIKFEYLDSVDSTNDYLKRNIRVDDFDTAVIAQNQWKGKGRRGRIWIDSPENVLKISYRKKIIRPIHNLPLLSPWIALQLCLFLRSKGFKNVSLKWPNDLFKNGGKLAGILIESVSRNNASYLIIGIGINLFKNELIQKLSQRKIGFLYDFNNISENEIKNIRTEIALGIIETLIQAVEAVPDYFDENISSSWCKVDALFGKKIKIVCDQNRVVEGIEDGINKYGEIKIKTSDRSLCFNCGEVSIDYE